MHNAPAVTYPVGRWSLRPLCLFALAAGGLVVLAFWWQQSVPSAVPAIWLFMTWLAGLVATVRASRQDDSGALTWSGAKWTWSSRAGASNGTLTVLVDVQATVVVIFRSDDDRVLWFWLRRSVDPSVWPALRRALVSTSGRGVLPADRTKDGASW